MNQTDKESYVRWQQLTVSQFGNMNNLLITLGVALLAYYANLLIENKIRLGGSRFLMVWALVILLCSIGAGLACGLSRLADFRATTQVIIKRSSNVKEANDFRTKSKRQGKISRAAFIAEVVLFALGAVVGVAVVYWQLH
jgi:hypothetical protein